MVDFSRFLGNLIRIKIYSKHYITEYYWIFLLMNPDKKFLISKYENELAYHLKQAEWTLIESAKRKCVYNMCVKHFHMRLKAHTQQRQWQKLQHQQCSGVNNKGAQAETLREREQEEEKPCTKVRNRMKKKTLTIYNISKRGIWQYRTCNLQTTYLEWDTYIRELYVAVTN